MIRPIASGGRLLRFMALPRPLVALRNGKARGVSIDCVRLDDSGEERSAQAALATLDPYELEKVDLAVMDEGAARLHTWAGEEPSLIIAAAAQSTLISPRGRQGVLERLHALTKAHHAAIALEITALHPGVPSSRMAELVAYVRPACKGVFARVVPTGKILKALETCGLSGAAVETAYLKEVEDPVVVARLIDALHVVGPRAILHNLPSMAAINAARLAGATYATIDVHTRRNRIDPPPLGEGDHAKHGGEGSSVTLQAP